MKVVIRSTRNFFFLYIDNNYDTMLLSMQECTMELRASIGDHIRFVFYPISNIRDDYDQDYIMSIPKSPCLKIRDVDLKNFNFIYFLFLF
jgi:hypothetical protein